MLRRIYRFFDLGELRRHLAPFYSHTGRPSIDSELMIRMLIVCYCFGIRSERRLCEEVHLNSAYRWIFRLDLAASVPDHSTSSKDRHGRFREATSSAAGLGYGSSPISSLDARRAGWSVRPSAGTWRGRPDPF